LYALFVWCVDRTFKWWGCYWFIFILTEFFTSFSCALSLEMSTIASSDADHDRKQRYGPCL